MKKQNKARASRRAKRLTLKKSEAAVKESRVILFGTESDPEVQTSKARIEKSGRTTEVQPRAPFDSGLGRCGKHICSCRVHCLSQYNPTASF